jgi:hypothetical protein
MLLLLLLLLLLLTSYIFAATTTTFSRKLMDCVERVQRPHEVMNRHMDERLWRHLTMQLLQSVVVVAFCLQQTQLYRILKVKLHTVKVKVLLAHLTLSAHSFKCALVYAIVSLNSMTHVPHANFYLHIGNISRHP